MALVKTPNPKQNTSVSMASMRLKMEVGTIAMDSSYPTGGEAITFPSFDTKPIAVMIESEDGYVFKYDRTNEKIMAYYGDYSNGSDGALVQVANTVDLSGVTAAAYIAVGY